MALISTLITKAFYLAKAGGLSKQGGQLPSAAQQTDALAILNGIIDSLSLEAEFNSFLYTLTIPSPSSTEIYIGRNLTPVSGVTIIDEDPFKLIFGASIGLPTVPYALVIQNLSELTQAPTLTQEGQPGYLYWAIQEQSNNIFTRIFLYPSPNQAGDLKLSGVKVLPATQTLPATVLPTFFSYLKYLLAEELAAEYGNLEVWDKTSNPERLKKYRNIIANNSPISGSPNDLSSLLNRDFYGSSWSWW